MRRCTGCGATNPAAAEWCGQCYGMLRTDPDPDPETAPGPGPDPRPPAVASGDVPDEEGVRDGYRLIDTGVEWSCERCGTWTSIESLRCTTCGTSLADRYAAAEAKEPHDWPRARLLSLVCPGLGHLAVGRVVAGATRLGLFWLWLAFGLGLVVSAGQPALLPALPPIVGALTLYGVSLADIERLAEDRSEVLSARVLLWLVVGVTGGVLVMGVPAFLTATG